MKIIDAKGLKCPEPLMLLHKAIYEAESGEEVRLISTDPMSAVSYTHLRAHET